MMQENPDGKESSGKLMWDIEEIARALKISQEDVREYFTELT